MDFLDKLTQIESRYEELNAQLSDARVLADPSLYKKTARAHAEVREVVERYREWKTLQKSLEETNKLLEESASDPAMKALASEELQELEKRREKMEAELKL